MLSLKLVAKNISTDFVLLVTFYTSWKHQETSGFLMFQGVYKESRGTKCDKSEQ